MKLKKYEEDDCTVFALSEATGVSYETARRYMEKWGRKVNNSVPPRITNKAYRNSDLGGYRIIPIYSRNGKRRTLDGRGKLLYKNFLKSKYLRPRCIIRVPGHVAAIVNGTLCQWSMIGDRQEVCTVWEVKKKSGKRTKIKVEK